jgi:hypothetical protein
MNQSNVGVVFTMHDYYHPNNWLKILFMVVFAYNNTMHSSTQQTCFFTNHDLHLKFDIQGVNKIMKPTSKE